jgi:hypothetical protein
MALESPTLAEYRVLPIMRQNTVVLPEKVTSIPESNKSWFVFKKAFIKQFFTKNTSFSLAFFYLIKFSKF